MNDQKEQIIEKVRAANNILVTVSTNPSVDQLAACIGLTLMLNKMNKHGTAVFSGQVPSTIEFLHPQETIEHTTDSLRDFIISLDKSKADKLRYKVEDEVVKIFITPYRSSITDKDLVFSQGDFNVDVVIALGVHRQQDLDAAITAHGRILHDAVVVSVNNTPNADLGAIHWQDLSASSLSEMVASLTGNLGDNLLDGQIATAFLTGIVAETNHFGNQKTTPQTMTISAALLGAGANQQLVASKLAQPAAPKPQPQPGQQPKKGDGGNVPGQDGNLKISHDGGNQPKQGKKGNPQQGKGPQNQPNNQNQRNQPNQNQPKPADKKDVPKSANVPAGPADRPESLDAILKAADEELEKSINRDQPAPPAAPVHPIAPKEPAPMAELPKVELPKPADIPAPAPAVQSAPPVPPAPVQPPAPKLSPEPFTPPAAPPTTPLPQPVAATPLDIVEPAPSTPAPVIDQKETLTDIEESVHSPHIDDAPPAPEAVEPATDVDSARKAVEDALKGSAGEENEPLESLNAVPVNLNLGHDDTPQPAPQESAQPASDLFGAPAQQPGPGTMPTGPASLPDYLMTPSMGPAPAPSLAPQPSPVLPPNPAANEPAPLKMSPADQPFTMPLPPNMNAEPPQVMPPASTGLPPQGPPPPPVPPPMMPPFPQ